MAKTGAKRIGDKVEVTGYYVCMNCGYYQYFEKEDEFEDCTSCGESDITWEQD